MYETFFGLKRRPFLAVPDTESYFSIPQMEASRQMIERAVRRGEGVSLIVGASGIGKTLLLRMLRKSLEVEYTVSLIANGRLESPKAFFQQLLYELRFPFSNADETELRLMLYDFARQEESPGVVLLIDEAQFLDRSVLEEIRLLMNCDDGSVPYFRVVLAGTLAFEEKLTHPDLEAFNQRIVSRSYLETMSREETFQYVVWQTSVSRISGQAEENKPTVSEGLSEMVAHSGTFDEDSKILEGRRFDAPHIKGTEPIFTLEARHRIYRLTEGLPRLINQLCDNALQLAAQRVVRQVDESLVQAAWSRLQQIDPDSDGTEPESPAKSPAVESESIEEIIARKKATFQLKTFDSSVEFGSLEDSGNVESTADRSTNEYKPPYPEDDDELETSVVPESRLNEDFEPEIVSDEPSDSIPEVFENLIDAVDTEILFSSDGAEVECLKALPNNEELEEAISVVATVLVEDAEPAESVCETTDETETVDDPAEEQTTSPCRMSSYPVRRRRIGLHASKRLRTWKNSLSISWTIRVFDTMEPWIGNVSTRLRFIPVRRATSLIAKERSGILIPKIESTSNEVSSCRETTEISSVSNVDCEETPMNRETLEKYGEEVLEGRPPFVRKEPNYVYQTTDSTPERKTAVSYPDPETGNVILLNWATPEYQIDCGSATAYRNFVDRVESSFSADPENEAASYSPGESRIESVAEFESARVVRLALDERTDSVPATSRRRTALDESFDQVVAVEKSVVSLDELYRPEWNFSQSMGTARKTVSVEDIAQQQIEAAVKRITRAAEKIEQAAEMTEDAGRHVKQAAVYVETEVQAALPTYRELFMELAEFQKTITRELCDMQGKAPSIPSMSQSAIRESNGNGGHRGQVLPFPKRPGFIPPEKPAPTSENEANPPSSCENDALPADEKSIDVRTLFQ